MLLYFLFHNKGLNEESLSISLWLFWHSLIIFLAISIEQPELWCPVMSVTVVDVVGWLLEWNRNTKITTRQW